MFPSRQYILMADLNGEEVLSSASAAVVEWSSVLCTFSFCTFVKIVTPRAEIYCTDCLVFICEYNTACDLYKDPTCYGNYLYLHGRIDRKADLEVWQAVVEENVPAAEEELLLTDTQQAGHQRIQGLLWREKKGVTHQALQTTHSKGSRYPNSKFLFHWT